MLFQKIFESLECLYGSHYEYLVRNPAEAALYSQKEKKAYKTKLAWQDPETPAFQEIFFESPVPIDLWMEDC